MPLRALTLLVLLPAVVACAAVPARRPQQPTYEAALADVAAQVRRCYRSPRVGSRGRQIVTRLRVRFGADGQLAGLPTVVWQDGVTPDNEAFAARMAEAAIGAVLRCTPLTLPPQLVRNGRGEFDLTFSPISAA